MSEYEPQSEYLSLFCPKSKVLKGIRIENKESLLGCFSNLPTTFPSNGWDLATLYKEVLRKCYPDENPASGPWMKEIWDLVMNFHNCEKSSESEFDLKNLDTSSVYDMTRVAATECIEYTDFYVHFIHQAVMSFMSGRWGSHEDCGENARTYFDALVANSDGIPGEGESGDESVDRKRPAMSDSESDEDTEDEHTEAPMDIETEAEAGAEVEVEEEVETPIVKAEAEVEAEVETPIVQAEVIASSFVKAEAEVIDLTQSDDEVEDNNRSKTLTLRGKTFSEAAAEAAVNAPAGMNACYIYVRGEDGRMEREGKVKWEFSDVADH